MRRDDVRHLHAAAARRNLSADEIEVLLKATPSHAVAEAVRRWVTDTPNLDYSDITQLGRAVGARIHRDTV